MNDMTSKLMLKKKGKNRETEKVLFVCLFVSLGAQEPDHRVDRAPRTADPQGIHYAFTRETVKHFYSFPCSPQPPPL